MPQDANGEIKIRLGVLAHADVGVPGRRLVWHPAHGWGPGPVGRRKFEFVLSKAGLGMAVGVAVVVLVLAALALRKPDAPVGAVAGPQAAGLATVATASAPVGHLPEQSASSSHAASNAEASMSGSTPPAAARRSLDGISSAAASAGPRPEWAAANGAMAGRTPVAHTTMSSFESSQTPASAVPVRARRKLPSPLALPSSGRGPETVATASPAETTRRVPTVEPDAAQPRASGAASAVSAPTSHVLFNDATAPPAARPDVLVAIPDANTVVVPGKRGLPAPFRVGERLPSGARLLKVDPRGGEAETDQGVIRLQ